MDIASPSTTELYLNAFDKNIQVDGVIKTIDDDYWATNIVPILYPLWDSDKDKLEAFIKYKDGTAKMNKTKYQRNQKTGAYKWVSYQFDLTPFMPDDVNDLYEKLVEKYTEYRVGQDNDLERNLAGLFAQSSILNWNKVSMIRNFLLMDSDWTQVGDAPIDADTKAKWVTYRQKLRDIPQDQKNMAANAVLFPVTPAKHAKMEDGKDYLSDATSHFYLLNQTVYAKFSSRIVNYLTLALSTSSIDAMPVTNLARPNMKNQATTGDTTLDNILKMIEEGET
tara:strand:+ start:686 stop:1525 length:840 start_codon:yes stop_codon:yes gene_type:complete